MSKPAVNGCISSGTSNTNPSAKKNATMIQENPSALSCQEISSAETPLTLKCVDENCNDTEQDIVFSEWAFVFGSNIQRSDYSFDELVNGNKEKASQLTLSDSTEGEGTFLRKYICNYRRLWENG